MKRCARLALTVLILSVVSAPLAAQVIDGDNAPHAENKPTEWEFIDSDSTTTFYVRGGFGYSSFNNGGARSNAVRKAFEQNFGAELGNSGYGTLGTGFSFSAAGFYKLGRIFSIGAGASLSPLVNVVFGQDDRNALSPSLPPDGSSIYQSTSEAFTQSLFLEAIAQFRVKILTVELGAGLNLERIGDKLTRKTVEVKNQIVISQATTTEDRRALIATPVLSIGIGFDLFLTEQFSLVPMYKGFLWQYGGADGATSDFKLVLQMKF
ncbi:MAG: hypothetical protein IAF08_15795 [Rhizobacter sp.]|nr:hypothetical protein [Chlorobiales bacterium]